MGNKRGEYLYLIHPDLHYFRRFNSPYNQDITSIHSNLTQGVLMAEDPDNYGELYVGQDFESRMEDLLFYLENKYKNLKVYHGARRFSEGDIPLYVMKFPKLYIMGDYIGNDVYLPMPMFEKLKTTKTNPVLDDDYIPTFKNEFRMNPAYNYGVFSRDLGGFVRNPNWNPIPDFLGYTYNKYAVCGLRQFNENGALEMHFGSDMGRDELEKFEKDLGGELFFDYSTSKMLDMYHEMYDKDVSNNRREISENEIFDKFNSYWDITRGLTPGDHKKDDRLM